MKWNHLFIAGVAALLLQACGDNGLMVVIPESDDYACNCSPEQNCCDGECVDGQCPEQEKDPPKNSCDKCDDGMKCCDDACVDLAADRENCGKCGKTCKSGQNCVDKKCVDSEVPPECTPKTCEEMEFNCGSHDDGCGETIKCGICSEDQSCSNGRCVDEGSCTPQSCEELKVACGSIDDGCGNLTDCGICEENMMCQNGACVEIPPDCVPKTCEELGLRCSDADDGCGKTLNCGFCSEDEVCTEGACVPKTVECTPKTCGELNLKCGTAEDGCSSILDCGSCPDGQICTNGACVNKPVECTPKTCAQAGISCGSIDDGCGKSLNCGQCGANQTCTGGKCVDNCKPTTCKDKGKNCGSIQDGCGGTLNCGSCSGGQECKDNVCKNPAATTKDIYPTRKGIKGLQPDFQDINQVTGNETHGVAMNLVWQGWQPSPSTSCGDGQVKYDGYCFNVDGNTANVIKQYTDRGVVVTAVVYGVPDWARRSCTNVVSPIFCAPTDDGAKHYGRFVGFLANYFNGEKGHGRIADFVIHNEVNATEWFNYGCTSGNCNVDTWTSIYAQSWNAAYDAARKEQKQAKVLISFEHHFGSAFDSMLNNARPVVSAETFLSKLIPKLGTREWRIAWHSYPPNLLDPAFGANDWPRVTFGNLGVLAGWLRKNYPDKPYTWEIQLTENGINGVNASMQGRQESQLCQAFKNVLGTPGIESFIYHRLKDHPDETKQGLGLGLWNSDGSPKPAWTTFALANRSGVGSGWPKCGFELLPYVEMMRGSNGSMHWVTTRQLPPGFNKEQSWKILRDKPKEDSVLVYECRVGGASGNHAMISPAANCENQFSMGPMGYLYTSQQPGTSAVYRCYVPGNGSHFISSDANCEGQTKESLVGYAIKM